VLDYVIINVVLQPVGAMGTYGSCFAIMSKT
jgi:hypothetical protein